MQRSQKLQSIIGRKISQQNDEDKTHIIEVTEKLIKRIMIPASHVEEVRGNNVNYTRGSYVKDQTELAS